MKASFLNHIKPPLTAMVQESTPDAAIDVIMNAHYQGADAFGIQLECLERQYRTPEELKRIFSFCMGKPIYITSYRNDNSTGMSDDECVELLMMGCEAGATLCDVIGDLYDPQPHELTFDPEAVRKQRAVIDRIHAMGAEVLISSHTHCFMDEETVVQYALTQKERGADVVKVVTAAETREQLEADMNIICRLKRELDGTKFLFLGSGWYSRPLRQLGPVFGCCMFLCVPQYRPRYSKNQPLLSAMKALRDNLMFLPE